MGAMDGINEAGLTVALLADNETPEPEPTGGPRVGLAEQQVVRYLLDTCATVDEAQQALLLAKHYYFFTPCHFVVADRTGRSFVWEHSPRRNHEVDRRCRLPAATAGSCAPTTSCTGGPIPPSSPTTAGRSARPRSPTSGGARSPTRNATVRSSIATTSADQFEAVRFAAPIQEARTFWHALYDVEDASAEVSFFLHDRDGSSRYSAPIRFCLDQG